MDLIMDDTIRTQEGGYTWQKGGLVVGVTTPDCDT